MTDPLTGETMAQQIARDQRDQDTAFFSDGWTLAHLWAVWGLVLAVIVYILGDGGWPWQRRKA